MYTFRRYMLRENENERGGQGSGSGSGTPAGEGSGSSSAGQGAAAGSGGQPQFTPEQQEHINALLAKEKRDAEARLKGSDEYKSISQKAKAHDDAAEAAKTESEKQQAKIDQLQTQIGVLTEKYKTSLIRSEFVIQAGQAGIPADRMDAAHRLLDLSEVVVDLDKDSVTGLDKAVKGLPQWVVTAGDAQNRRPAPDTNNQQNGDTMTREQAIAAEAAKLRASGRYA